MADFEKAHVVSTGIVSTKAKIRDFAITFDKPAAKMGRDEGPMPSEMFLGALGSCYTMGFTRIAKVRGVEIKSLEVDVEGRFGHDGNFDQLRMRVKVTSPASREQLETLDKLAERSCTVANVTKLTVERALEIVEA